MRKNFILDTSVILYNPDAIYSFDDNNIIIPIEVIEELDGFKRDMTELGHCSRMIANELDQMRRQGRLGEGVALPGGGLLRVHAAQDEDHLRKYGLRPGKKADNRILNLAVWLTESDHEHQTIIITKSINLRLKADALGIYAEDFEEPQRSHLQIYTGSRTIDVPADDIAAFNAAGQMDSPADDMSPNEYVYLRGDDEATTALARSNGNGTLHALTRAPADGILGIKPLNMHQCFALDALLDDNIKCVTLLGKAGTGKTLLAVAAGLYKVLKEDRYNKLLISRPTMPMGRDIGYLPGDIEEKMRPWMQPLYDAIEMIRDIDRRSRQRSLPPDILESDEVGIEPLTYIRGRSIPNQFMIIDEAQNLTPLEVKTIITRVGPETKIVLTGDPEQIDNPYVDVMSNGFTYLLHRFQSQSISAHVSLEKGERSSLAEIAANIL